MPRGLASSQNNTDDGLELVYQSIVESLKSRKDISDMLTSPIDGLRVRYFTYPEVADMSGNWVVLVPLVNELPSNFADKTWTTYDYLLHVDVWSKDRKDNRLIASYIRDLLWKDLGFLQSDDNDEHDSGIYRDSRRYTGTLHRSDLDKISKR